ncbi:hypothetical protein [Brevundimonas balnearis]|uniref:Uncharacterized protein n=1 Tax=Brevundimonas balnearis TaxID=1572858 RepID=A0ABV6R2T4_9CAUL
MKAPVGRPRYAASRALNSAAARTNHRPNVSERRPMIALYIILGFVAVVAAINVFEFGRVD